MAKAKKQSGCPFTGKSIFIKTCTNYFTGKCEEVTPEYFILKDAAWIAETGRFADSLKTGQFAEVEPYPDGSPVWVARAAVVDISIWLHPLPRTQK
jgi:hypothetical protein